MYSCELSVPLRLPIHTKKSPYFYLNLNVYRNAHYFTLDKAKKTFEEYVWNQVKSIPKLEFIGLEYTLHPGSRKKMDISNTCCIVDKFFCDTLVNAGVIEDDNYNICKKIVYLVGDMDKNNPHVTIYLEGKLK